MASVKNLKKDIDFLMSEIIMDAQLLTGSGKKSEDALTIINDAIDTWNQFYMRANHPDGKNDSKLVKQHYRSLCKDLMETSHKLFERISLLAS